MNPWLEPFWRDVHASMLVYARDQLNEELPAGLSARVDERLAIDASDGKRRAYVPDVAVTQSWDRPAGPVLGQGGARVAAAEPFVVDFGEEILRHVEIVNSQAQVVTAIELLSPSNKADVETCADWKRKRTDYLRGGISLVEIDLLRGGLWSLPSRALLKPLPPNRVHHYACVTRPPWQGRHEFYVMALREALPKIRVPLRPTDPDVALDLQALINQCYERGRYATSIDYSKLPDPPLPEEEVFWANDILSKRPK